MIKALSISLFFLTILNIGSSQLLPLELISSSGAVQENEITLQWSLGESMVHYLDTDNVSTISEGFHQFFQIDRDLNAEAQVRAEIFPNPSMDVFKVEVDNTGIIQYVISNSIGQTLRTGSFENVVDINMEKFVTGIYFMTLYTGARFEKTFSLLKI